MADPETQAQPAFDMAAMEQRLQQAAQSGAAAAVQQIAAQNRAQQAARDAETKRSQQTEADPIASTVLGNAQVAQALKNVAIKADSGRDAAIFYATNPWAAPFSGAIESRFNHLAAQGMPVDRVSIGNLIKGENLPKFVEAEIQRRAQDVRRAEQQAVAQGSRGAPSGRVVDARELSSQDLAAALDNVTF